MSDSYLKIIKKLINYNDFFKNHPKKKKYIFKKIKKTK